jgi:hypothetical protein
MAGSTARGEVAVARCRAEAPALRELDGAVVACHRAEDILADGLGPSG